MDTVLGPEMRSTGEVMGIDSVFGTAYAKSQAGAYGALPTKGRAFVSVANRDKRSMIFPARELVAHGFELLATSGTAEVLKRNGINATVVRKQSEGEGPDGEKTIVQLIHDGEVDLIVNTPYGTGGRLDGYDIRTAAVARGVPCLTTVQALAAAVQGIDALSRGDGRRPLPPGARGTSDRGPRAVSSPAEPGPRTPDELPPPLRDARLSPSEARVGTPSPPCTPSSSASSSGGWTRSRPTTWPSAGSGWPPASRCCAPSSRPLLAPRHQELRTEALGLRMHGPFGLAAGFDKNAVGDRRHGDARLRPCRDRHGHRRSRSPATRKKRLFRLVAGPGADQPHGLQQRGLARPSPPAWRPAAAGLPDRRSASTSARPRSSRRRRPSPTT